MMNLFDNAKNIADSAMAGGKKSAYDHYT
jgi:hypothetical protein